MESSVPRNQRQHSRADFVESPGQASTTSSILQPTPGPNETPHTPSKSIHWLRVANLAPSTTQSELLRIFFPHGADEARLADVQVSATGKVGFVGFACAEAAVLAAAKVDRFIPHGQKAALSVDPVEGVDAATTPIGLGSLGVPRILFRSPAKVPHAPPESPAVNLRQLVATATTTPLHIAHYTQQRSGAPSVIADEMMVMIESAPTSSQLRKLADGLACVLERWPENNALRIEIARRLLSLLYTASVSADERVAASGRLLGLLLANHFVSGDPFALALELLANPDSPERVVGVLAMINECMGMVFPVTEASYWARVADLTASASCKAVREMCAGHLSTRFSRSRPALGLKGLSPDAKPFVMPISESSSSTKKRMDEVRLRTVYISKVSASVLQGDLRRHLEQFGRIKKVRICCRHGFQTLYGFVEMASPDGAAALCSVGVLHLARECSIRVQPAKAPIQGVDCTDAAEIPFLNDPSTLCTFGILDAWRPLSDCAKRQD